MLPWKHIVPRGLCSKKPSSWLVLLAATAVDVVADAVDALADAAAAAVVAALADAAAAAAAVVACCCLLLQQPQEPINQSQRWLCLAPFVAALLLIGNATEEPARASTGCVWFLCGISH